MKRKQSHSADQTLLIIGIVLGLLSLTVSPWLAVIVFLAFAKGAR